MELTENEKKLIRAIIENVGLTIVELYNYSSEEERRKNILLLKEYIKLEATFYQGLGLTTEKYDAIISYVVGTYAEEQDHIDTADKVNSLNRFLDRIQYYSYGIDYLKDGHNQAVIDKNCKILYSEYVKASHKYPNYRIELRMWGFMKLAMSPVAEKEALDIALEPFANYCDTFNMFFGIKGKKYTQAAAQNGEAVIYDTSDLEERYRYTVQSLFGGVLDLIIDKLLSGLNDNTKDFIQSLDFIVLMSKLKSLIAMYPDGDRKSIYQTFYTLISEATGGNLDAIDAFESAFVEIESDIVSRTIYVTLDTPRKC